MTKQKTLTRANLKTPKAAIGVIFAILLIAIFWLLRVSVPADPQETGSRLNTNSACNFALICTD